MRKPILFVAGLSIGAAVAGTLVYVFQSDQPPPPLARRSPSARVQPSPTASVRPPWTLPSPLRSGITKKDSLRMEGIGPITVGMTVDEAEAAAGIRLRVQKEFTEACRYAYPVGGPRNLAFMVSYRKIVRVDVFGDSSVKTASGVGVGDQEEMVLRIYGERINREPHPYRPEDGSYLVYRPANEENLLLIFETAEGKVTSFRSGLEGPVRAIEGCA